MYNRIEASEEKPTITGEYFTSLGYLKFDATTQSFYNDGSPVRPDCWFKEIEEKETTFEEAVRPAIKWVNNNRDPRAIIFIEPTSARCCDPSSGQVFDYLKD